MKQLLCVVAFAAVMTACNSNQGNLGKQGETTPAADTAGLAEFQAQKAQAAIKAMEDSIRKSVEAEEAAKRASANAKKSSRKKSSVSKSESIAYQSSNAAEEKKGWSKKAKGAVIGAGTGAAAGAVINKKDRVVGGVVGGVVGAAAGYGIGRHKDKKDGRKQD